MTALQRRFGTAVRRLRTAADFSQEDFAAKADVARAYMGKLERGAMNPTLSTIGKIATALKMTVGELMAEVDREK